MILDTLFFNANIITMDPTRPVARSMGIWNGQIVGFDSVVEQLSATTKFDLNGKTVLPGFHDSHVHMCTVGRSLINIDASTMTSLAELYEAVKVRADETDEDSWVVVDRYDQSTLGGHPTRAGLDSVAPHRRVVVNHRTTHMLVASTPVFEYAGAMRPDWNVPPGGFVETDSDGAPAGLVGEQAMAPFRALLRPYSVESLVDAIGRANQLFLSEGITSVDEAGIGNSAIVGSSTLEALSYQIARERGLLGVRVRLMVSMENLVPKDTAESDAIGRALDLGLRSDFGDEFLSIGALKMFTDGALSSRTAALSQPYCDHDSSGVMQFDAHDLTSLALDAAQGGWQLAVHAIGDQAVDVALDVIETVRKQVPDNHRRHRIEHSSVVREDQLQRYADNRVVASIQPEFVSALGDSVLSGLGSRSDMTYRHKSFIDSGIAVTGGSDRPVVKGAPLQGIQDAISRRTQGGRLFSPDEAVDRSTAIQAFTSDPAYAAHQENSIGRLKEGYQADLVVLEQDIFTCHVEDISNIPIFGTAVAGRFLYDPHSAFC